MCPWVLSGCVLRCIMWIWPWKCPQFLDAPPGCVSQFHPPDAPLHRTLDTPLEAPLDPTWIHPWMHPWIQPGFTPGATPGWHMLCCTGGPRMVPVLARAGAMGSSLSLVDKGRCSLHVRIQGTRVGRGGARTGVGARTRVGARTEVGTGVGGWVWIGLGVRRGVGTGVGPRQGWG